jgi:hypothetical protein
MMGEDAETIRLLREILKWTRFSGMKEVKLALTTALESPQKRLVYQLSNGDKGSIEIAKAAGVSDWTVRNYWRIWSHVGLVEPMRSGGGNRFKRSFDFEDFGIQVKSKPMEAELPHSSTLDVEAMKEEKPIE